MLRSTLPGPGLGTAGLYICLATALSWRMGRCQDAAYDLKTSAWRCLCSLITYLILDSLTHASVGAYHCRTFQRGAPWLCRVLINILATKRADAILVAFWRCELGQVRHHPLKLTTTFVSMDSLQTMMEIQCASIVPLVPSSLTVCSQSGSRVFLPTNMPMTLTGRSHSFIGCGTSLAKSGFLGYQAFLPRSAVRC